MEIEGTYTLTAPLELVWTILLDPISIQKALPGCEEFDQDSVNDYRAALRIKTGPLQGLYHGGIHLDQIEPFNGFDLVFEGQGDQGPISGQGQLHLEGQGGETIVHYAGTVELENAQGNRSPRLFKTTANALIRQYFEGIDQQIRIQTRVYTTEIRPHPPKAEARAARTGTISMQDWVEKVRRDRRVTAIVALLLLLSFFMAIGAVVILWVVLRWGFRYFVRHVATALQENQNTAEAL